ncbi:MAG: ferredoxin reductase family protein [Sporichthyaceae bacterium]
MAAPLSVHRAASAPSVRRHGLTARQLFDAAGWTSLVAVGVLWVTGPAAADIAESRAHALTALARLCGLLAAVLLLLQVLLMARVPAMERAYGRDVLARRHRVVGFASFALMWVHVFAVVGGYSWLVSSSPLDQATSLIRDDPGMVLAVAGVAALTVVALSSMRRARRALRYETWHLLHLYAYLGVGLALPHQIWTGASFTASPLARVFWIGAYLACAGALLTFRVALPLWRTVRHQITVEKVVRESADTVSVYLRGRSLDRLPARAGQFLLWRFLDGPWWTHAHPYSLSAAPTETSLRLTAKGDVDRLLGLRPGTWVAIEGPYGRLTDERRSGRSVALFGCGIGVTPLRALLESLPYSPGQAVLVHRVRNETDLILRDELDQLANARGAQVYRLIGPRRAGRSWLPDGNEENECEAMRRLLSGLDDVDVFVCGPTEWTAAVRDAAVDAGVPARRIHIERFAW